MSYMSEIRIEKEGTVLIFRRCCKMLFFLPGKVYHIGDWWVASKSNQESSGAEVNSNFLQLLLCYVKMMNPPDLKVYSTK